MIRPIIASIFFVGYLASMIGCEAKTKFNPKDFTAEEKAKIKAEDQAVADEESQGSVGKKKKK